MSEPSTPDERTRAPRPLPKPGLLDIQAYVPGKAKADGVETPVKLSSNENILGCSDAARQAYAASAADLQIYPDSRATVLREAIAGRYRLEPERLVFGCGSDELFSLLCQVFLEPGDNIVQGEFAFASYAIGARACQAEVRSAREPNYRLDVDELLSCVDPRTRIAFVANPANPTGTWIPFAEVRRLHEGLPPSVLLVLDGAYAEFAAGPDFDDGLDLARTAPNLLVTHTFSKLHGLASLRVGWGYGPAEVIAAMERIRPPFNTSAAAQRAAVAALADEDFQRRSLELVARWRPWLDQQLSGLGLDVVRPAAANFLTVGFPVAAGRTAAEAEAFLASRGLIVRGLANYGLPDHLRFSIGLEEHNRAVVAALAEFLGR